MLSLLLTESIQPLLITWGMSRVRTPEKSIPSTTT
jgi:hypothetical protein